MIDAFIDGELNRQDRTIVREHLKRCGPCRELVQELVDVGEQLTSLTRVKCPARVEKRIREHTVEKERSAERRPSIGAFFESLHLSKVSVGLAAAVIVAFLVIRPFFREAENPIPVSYTPEQILQAREEAQESLSYLGKKINHTQNNVLEQILLKDLPKTVRNSIRKTVPLFQGGQG
jgi:hypothetical protein